MTVAIHQPNFFPWLGYFDKIFRSDLFVILDDVQIPKSGGSWINRVKLLVSGKENWATVPVDRNYSGTININQALFSSKEPWRQKVLNTLMMNYRKTPFFNEAFPFFESLVQFPDNTIAAFNSNAIVQIAGRLGADTGRIRYSSALAHEGSSNELLVSIVKELNGNVYMCGGGADGYQDPEVFSNAGITLLYQQFRHPQYKQAGTDQFQPGLSVIDAVMNNGWEATGDMLRKHVHSDNA